MVDMTVLDLTVGLSDLEGLFQTKEICDSVDDVASYKHEVRNKKMWRGKAQVAAVKNRG